MPTGQLSEVVRHLRRAVLRRDGADRTDRELLEDFLARRGGEAMEVLVFRHGPMVWGVCRRVLADYHDAEDAFQATFLVLARKAASIASRELLANWLYGVAHQTARKARATAAKQRRRERQVTTMPEPAATEPDARNDLRPLLDQELSRLPDKYRAAVVLCDLEGKTRKEAAGQLGVPEGTVASRLARARAMLARRLSRKGVVLSGGALAAALSRNAASAGMPASVVSFTIKALTVVAAGNTAAAGVISPNVSALVEGVLKSMLLTKLKVVSAVVLVLGVIALGGGLIRHPTAAGQQGGPWPEVIRPAGVFRLEAVPGVQAQRYAASFRGGEQPQTGSSRPGSDQESKSPPDGPPSETAKEGPGGGEEGGLRFKATEYNALYDKTLGVLSDYFRLEHANRYEGRIETFPAYVEPAGRPQVDEATLRRRAVVQILALSEGGFFVHVRVAKERKAARQMSPAAAETKWEPAGRDGELEQIILRRLTVGTGEGKPGRRGQAEKPLAEGVTSGRRPANAATGDGDRIQPGDRLQITVPAALPGNPIRGVFRVEAAGTVALGPGYGRVRVRGLSPVQAEAAVREHLAKTLKQHEVSVTRYDPLPEGDVSALVQRVQRLEDEVRELRTTVQRLRKQ